MVSPGPALDPDDVASARALAAAAAASDAPSSHTLPLRVQRAGMRSGAERLHRDAEKTTIAGVPVRVLTPPSPRATYLHVHGGGWTMGGEDQQDQRLWRIATEVGVRVVSVGYRLAPEHPWPAGADDCEAVARALDGPLLIGGESAGAHLSAVTLLRLRSPAFVGANLLYGCYDLGMSRSQRAYGTRTVVISRPIISWHLDQLLPGMTEQERRHPSVSPLFAGDFSDLPPALLTVGDDDPFLDDSVKLAARWPNASLDVYEGGFHAFDLIPGVAIGEVALQRQLDFLSGCLDG